MTTAMTRATIAIVRVSMARPYSDAPAVLPDPPSGTPLPLTDGCGRPERLLAGSRSGRGPGIRRRAIRPHRAPASVEGNSDGLTARIHHLGAPASGRLTGRRAAPFVASMSRN